MKAKKRKVPALEPSTADAIKNMLSKKGAFTEQEKSDFEKYVWNSVSNGRHKHLRTMLSNLPEPKRTDSAEEIVDRLISTVRVSADDGKSEHTFWGFGISAVIQVRDERWRSCLEKPILEIQPAFNELLNKKTFSQASGLALVEGQSGTVLRFLLVGESVTTISDAEWRELLESVAKATLSNSGKRPGLPASFSRERPEPWHLGQYGFASCLTMLGIVMSRYRAMGGTYISTDRAWAEDLAQTLKDGLEKEVAPIAEIQVMPLAVPICSVGDLVLLRKDMLEKQVKKPRWESFYTFNEWRRRYAGEFAGAKPESLAAHYSSFLKKWYARALALNADGYFIRVRKVDTGKMRDYISRNRLDESDEQAWSEAAMRTGLPVVEPIIELVDENLKVAARNKVATITVHSADEKLIAYMLAQIHTPEKEVVATYAAWNPLIIGPERIEKALIEKLREKDVRELRVVREMRPIEVCPDSGKLVGPITGGRAENIRIT